MTTDKRTAGLLGMAYQIVAGLAIVASSSLLCVVFRERFRLAAPSRTRAVPT